MPHLAFPPIKRVVAVVAALVVAVLLGGCVKITGSAATQLNAIGPLRTTHSVCLALNTSTGACPSSNTSATTAGSAQMLFAYRVPTWAPEPTGVQFTASTGETMSFTRNTSYEVALQADLPAAGTRWYGFLSEPNPEIPANAVVTGNVAASFALPDDQPAQFSQFAVSGWRFTSPGASRDVVCGNPIESGGPTDKAGCKVGWWPNGGAADADPSDDGPEILLRNRLTLTAPPTTTQVVAGSSVAVPFKTSGSVGFVPVDVPTTASTTAPGATATSPATTPVAGTRDVPAMVSVPASTPAGLYSVRLTVGTGLGIRTVDAPLQVLPAPTTGGGGGAGGGEGTTPSTPTTPTPTTPTGTTPGTPTLPTPDVSTFVGSVAAAADAFAAANARADLRAGKLRIKVRASRRGYIEATLKSGKKLLAKGQIAAKRKGLVTVKLKLRPDGRTALRGNTAVTGTLTVRFKPRGKPANKTSVVVTIPAT